MARPCAVPGCAGRTFSRSPLCRTHYDTPHLPPKRPTASAAKPEEPAAARDTPAGPPAIVAPQAPAGGVIALELVLNRPTDRVLLVRIGNYVYPTDADGAPLAAPLLLRDEVKIG